MAHSDAASVAAVNIALRRIAFIYVLRAKSDSATRDALRTNPTRRVPRMSSNNTEPPQRLDRHAGARRQSALQATDVLQTTLHRAARSSVEAAGRGSPLAGGKEERPEMTRIHSTPRGRRARWSHWAVVLALPVTLTVVGCGDDGDGMKTATPTATRPAATATATSPPTTATAPPAATSTATRPASTPTPVNTVGATPTMNADANAACQKLVRCGQCFSDSTGNCISTAACAARLSADVALCINAGSACSPDMLGDCVFLGCDGSDATGECE
jgi:hypothetical protein